MWLSIVLLFIPNRFTSDLDHLWALVVSPLTSATRQVALSASESISIPQFKSVPKEKYDRLQNDFRLQQHTIAVLQQKLDRLNSAYDQVAGIGQALGQSQTDLVMCDVVTFDITHQRRLGINRGSKDNLAVGQLVLAQIDGGPLKVQQDTIDNMCIIGVIDEVAPSGLRFAQVRLIDDPGFEMPVFIEPRWDRKETIDRWQGHLKTKKGYQKSENPHGEDATLMSEAMGQIHVAWLLAKVHDVAVGDLVYGRSDGMFLPIALPIGYVHSCKIDQKNPLMWDIEVTPYVDLNKLKKVVVVSNRWQAQ